MTISVLLIVIGCLIHGISSECSMETSLLYQEIPEDNYNRTWHDISDPGDPHPLGFYRNKTIYDETDKNPCISLDNVIDRHVEIMFEVIPSVPLCYTVNGGAPQCESSGRHQSCMTPTGQSKNLYEFFADSGEGASESDSTFWYRLVRGPISAEDSEDGFCMQRENKFPGNLLKLPPNFTNSPGNAQTPSTAVKASIIAPLLCICLFVHLFA